MSRMTSDMPMLDDGEVKSRFRPQLVITAAVTVILAVGVMNIRGARAAGQDGHLEAVPDLDVKRYAGTWYEVARIPNRFQKKCVGNVTANYGLRKDGRFDVVNRCRTENGGTISAKGIARRVTGQPASHLQVRFAPAFLSFLSAVWAEYRVIAIDANYEYAAVGTPDRKYLWILSRTPQLDPARYRALVERAKAQGFNIVAIVETPQSQSSNR